MTEQGPTFFIGELAERTGVSRDAIRYYEASGVLPPPDRSGSGYRMYRQEDVHRIVLLGQAQALGLSHEQPTEAECRCHLIEYAARVEPSV